MNDRRKQVNPPRDDRLLTHDRHRLKRRRVIAGLTLREAGDRAGVHFTTIHKLETGERDAGPHILTAIAKAYGCDVEDLLPPEPKRAAVPLTGKKAA